MGRVQKVLGVVVLGMIAATAFAVSAGAQTTTTTTGPTPPGQCVFAVTPTTVTTFPATVDVSGTAPVGTTAQVFVNGTGGASMLIPASGQFNFPNVTVNAATDGISVNFTFGNQNAYTSGCATAQGETVVRVQVEAAAAAQQLAFTGSSHTGTYVLIGVGALVLGLVLVVGARRRSSVRS